AAGQLRRPVGGARVHDDDLVGKAVERPEAVAEHRGLVAHDHRRRQARRHQDPRERAETAYPGFVEFELAANTSFGERPCMEKDATMGATNAVPTITFLRKSRFSGSTWSRIGSSFSSAIVIPPCAPCSEPWTAPAWGASRRR